MLREGVLEGVAVAAEGGLGEACAALGATVVSLAVDVSDDDGAIGAARALPRLDVLVARPGFTGGYEALRAAVDTAFLAARVATTEQLAPQESGLVVLVAPRPGDGELSGPARAALENTARTLSVEWARLGVRAVAVLPGDATTEAQLADLVCFLCSPGGAYYSGCAFTLGTADTV